jgi:hypothetical protein
VRRARELPKAWRPLPLLGLWLAAGAGLSAVTGRVRDWFDMTDELRYERLAMSIARSHSLVPRIHDVDVQSFAQLYPALIAPVFAHGLAPHDVRSAHLFNAWLMTSACIPAYLIARRVVGRPLAYAAAALSVAMPWIVYTTMLMTEVAAYPASLWALLAIERTVVRPSWKADGVAVAGLALAFVGRTELLVLVFVPPPAILAYELGRVRGSRPAERFRLGVRRAVAAHPVLAVVYVALLGAGIAAELAGRLSAVVGVYGIYAQQNTLFPAGTFGSLATHVALFALGFGLLPFLVGAAWLLANVVRPAVDAERHAFACVAGFALLAILFQGTNFDVRYTGFVHDRFLLYLVAPVVIGMCCALESARKPRVSLAFVTTVTVVGFATGSFPAYTWQLFPALTPDSPMSGILRRLVDETGSLHRTRIDLSVAAVLLAAAFAAAAALLRRTPLVLGTLGFAAAAMTWLTVVTFTHLFGTNGWSGRPVTSTAVNDAAWIDRAVGTRASVTEIPYLVSSDVLVNEGAWRDLEFWNASVVRDAAYPGGDAYAYTGIWFPKLDLRFDPQTGRANVSPTRLVAVSDKDTRFALAGTGGASSGDIRLVDAAMPWRAEWLSFGFYDDGWTKPGVTARIRVFPAPGQRRPEVRTLSFAVHAADGVHAQSVRLVSNLERWRGTASDSGSVISLLHLCVPASGYTEIRITTPKVATIPPDLAVPSTSTRRGGVFFGETALADEVGGPCRA